jgi:adenine-specific DNA-methyltransferase
MRINCSAFLSKDPLQIILENIKKQGELLGVICNVNNGVFAGADSLSLNKKNKYKINDANEGEGIFVLKNKEVENLKLTENELGLIKPLYKNSDIRRYYTNSNNELNLINLRYTDRPKIANFPNIQKHLNKFKDLLSDRPRTGTLESAFNNGYWYVMSTSRKLNFDGAKIVFPQRSSLNTFGYNENVWYAMSDVFYITSKIEFSSLSLKYILALLNSKLYYVWLYFRGKRKGETLELTGNPVSEIPIKNISEFEQKIFIDLVDQILTLKKRNKDADTKNLESQIDQLVYKLYCLTPEEIEIVENSSKK